MLTQMLKELEKIEKFSLQQVAEDLVRKIISNLDSFKTTPVGDIPADMLIFFLSGFSFTTIHKSQDCRGSGRVFL